MLQGKLELHDIRDTEAFCSKIAGEKWDLRPHEREDLLAFLVAATWELSLKYERGDPQFPARFTVYATPILRNRAVDWYRKERGRTRYVFRDRTYERALPELVSIDGSELVELVAEFEGDGIGGLVRALREGDSETARRNARNGSSADGHLAA